MGDFYQVVKTIKGRLYLYKQRTFRVGGQVCTESHYLGPASAGEVARVKAEQALRKGTPTVRQVDALVKGLADPTRAAAVGIKAWGDKAAVNTTFSRDERLDRHLVH